MGFQTIAFLLGIAVVIGFILFHHAQTHEGKFASLEDFQNAMFNSVKSHEGIIVLLVIFAIGVVLGASPLLHGNYAIGVVSH